MSKYHAGKNGRSLCGSEKVDGFKTVVLRAAEWNALPESMRCKKCVAQLKGKTK